MIDTFHINKTFVDKYLMIIKNREENMKDIYIIISYIEHLTSWAVCQVLYIHRVCVCVYYLTFIEYLLCARFYA